MVFLDLDSKLDEDHRRNRGRHQEGPLDSEIWPAIYTPLIRAGKLLHGAWCARREMKTRLSLPPMLAAAVRKIDPRIGSTRPDDDEPAHQSVVGAYLHRSAAWMVGGFAFLARCWAWWDCMECRVFGVPADAGDWRADRAGGAARRGLQADFARGGVAGGGGHWRGAGLRGGAATLMRKLLYGTQTWDVPTLLGVAVVLRWRRWWRVIFRRVGRRRWIRWRR